MDTERYITRLPKVQIWRRGAALLIDYWVVALFSSLATSSSEPGVGLDQALLFLLLWLGMRVILVTMNQGQSLGRWALDMKVVDTRFARLPEMVDLFKREGLMGIEVLLVHIGLEYIAPGSGIGLLLFLPLAIDCSIVNTDPLARQAFHDRIAGTVIGATRRGYSLDLKVKRWYRLGKKRIEELTQSRSDRNY
jgi:uncharacterized RDD family membrane protein YckC